MQGGSQANNTGNALGSFVEGILQRKGYVEFWNHKEQIFVNRKTVGGKHIFDFVVNPYEPNLKLL